MTTPPTSASAPAEPLSPALDRTFKIGLVLKGLDGILEVAGGILLLFLSPHAIQQLVRALTAHELSEDPHDLIACTPPPTSTPASPSSAPSTCSATASPRSSWWPWC